MPPTDPTKHIKKTCDHPGILQLARVNKYLRDRYGRLASQEARDVVSSVLGVIRREIGWKADPKEPNESHQRANA